MPSWDIFEGQPKSYRESVLPPEVTARVAVEQGSVLGWERYVGAAGRVIGMTHVRRLRAAEGIAAQVRLRAGTGRRRSPRNCSDGNDRGFRGRASRRR